jgi:hypothetical protein
VKPDRPHTYQLQPKRNPAASNLYELLGEREGLLELLDGTQDDRLLKLQGMLMDDATGGKRVDGLPKMTLGKMLAIAGVSEKDVYDVFKNRMRAETEVTIAAAEPRLAGELIERASKRYVLCRRCAGTKKYLIHEGEDDEKEVDCKACDKYGKMLLEGDQKSVELYFDLSKLKQPTGITVTNDNRHQSVVFQAGMVGTAPSPVAMIRSLEAADESGPVQIPAKAASSEGAVIDAVVVDEKVKVKRGK